MVFFRMLQPELPGFIQLHLREQVDCLAQFFDVTVVTDECDYGEICERFQPDLTLFESGAYAGKRRITGTSAHPQVPKLGFIHSDAYCLSRAASLSDMAQWGVESFVSISVAMAEYTPDIADDMFVWPNFVDPGLYRDYGESKIVPVFFAGSQAIHYPWRNRINRTVAAAYPSLTTPHGGWFSNRKSARMIFGERYARMLNAAQVVPTCGTIAKEVVRKHFEIPAARSCLLTERAASVEAAGFVDMVNCVVADENDVLDKLDHLFEHPEELARITDAGHQLVHSRHTAAQRDEILQWYTLRRALRPGQRIVQRRPFAPLEIADAGTTVAPLVSGGLDRVLLAQGDEAVRQGRYADAENLYRRCLNYHFMPEPVLRLAVCALEQGRPTTAMDWLNQTIEGTLLTHRAAEPDPVEWAYLVRALLCAGRVADGANRARQYPGLRHPELDRTRVVVSLLAGSPVEVHEQPVRRSVHLLPEPPLPAWITGFVTMLDRAGQVRLAVRLQEYAATAGRFEPSVTSTVAGPVGPVTVGRPTEMLAKGRLLGRKVQRRLDYELSRLRSRNQPSDPLLRRLAELAEKEDISSALLLDETSSDPQTGAAREALLGGLRANPNRPLIVQAPPDGPATAERGDDRSAGLLPELAAAYGVAAFDLLWIADPGSGAEPPADHMANANFVVVNYLNGAAGFTLCRRLLADPRYLLIDHDPGHEQGYAIFRSTASALRRHRLGGNDG
ncbi:glycosyltransferase [Solwaraspora sp. WMMD791]|uniref:glycosyltransferase family protein n=1 Tax=Solwaraspora sp. WMMD791 TaxID=3016086 RepID=UPI00249C7233|nr:glycosyltransferase [Solwaraspora sp. WMMD791]WFE30196.1 glycosyltransferase [Solwaraspora sp. WMMD791]